MIQQSSTDPFLSSELAIFGVLYAAFEDTASLVKQALINELTGGYDPRKIEETLSANLLRMQRVLSPDLQSSVRETLNAALKAGFTDSLNSARPADRVSARPLITASYELNNTPSARRVVDSAVESVAHYANKYYGDALIPSLRVAIFKVVEGTSATSTVDVALIASAIEKAFSVKAYWRVLSNAAASRVYHYGYLKTAQLNGKRAYQWHTVVDSSTSDVCLGLHGQEFWIADAVNLIESVAMTDDPEAATKLMPWRTPDNAGGADAANLRLAGVSVPPAHPHCRSTLVTV